MPRHLSNVEYLTDEIYALYDWVWDMVTGLTFWDFVWLSLASFTF